MEDIQVVKKASSNMNHLLVCFIPLVAASPVAQFFDGRYPSGGNQQLYFNQQPAINSYTTDIIKQTRTLSNSVQQTLRNLAANPASAVIVDRIIGDKDNVCLNSLEEGLNYIETATGLVENAGNDIKLLIKKVNSMKKLRDPAEVVGEVAAVLRILEPLVNKIAPSNPEACQASPEQGFGSLRSLAVVVADLAEDPSLDNLQVSPAGREELRKSANAIYAVTSFLTQLRQTFFRFQTICTADKQYNLQSISAIGDLINHLADLFGSLGGIKIGESTRKGKRFVEKVVGELAKIGPMDLGTLDCSRPGDFSLAAHTMDDISKLIKDVGVNNLQQQLGINLGFVFNA